MIQHYNINYKYIHSIMIVEHERLKLPSNYAVRRVVFAEDKTYLILYVKKDIPLIEEDIQEVTLSKLYHMKHDEVIQKYFFEERLLDIMPIQNNKILAFRQSSKLILVDLTTKKKTPINQFQFKSSEDFICFKISRLCLLYIKESSNQNTMQQNGKSYLRYYQNILDDPIHQFTIDQSTVQEKDKFICHSKGDNKSMVVFLKQGQQKYHFCLYYLEEDNNHNLHKANRSISIPRFYEQPDIKYFRFWAPYSQKAILLIFPAEQTHKFVPIAKSLKILQLGNAVNIKVRDIKCDLPLTENQGLEVYFLEDFICIKQQKKGLLVTRQETISMIQIQTENLVYQIPQQPSVNKKKILKVSDINNTELNIFHIKEKEGIIFAKRIRQ